jgi:hypothetical protein
MASTPRALSKRIVSDDALERLNAVGDTRSLSPEQASRILKKGLAHWDRKLRNHCAVELVERLHGGAASTLIPLRAAGRVYASCSSDRLLRNVDEKLVRYLRRAQKSSDATGELARGLLRAIAQTQETGAEETTVGKENEYVEDESEETTVGEEDESVDEESGGRDSGGPWEPLFDDIEPLGLVNERTQEFLFGVWCRSGDFHELYRVTTIPKRSGGERSIEEPAAALKIFQRKLLVEYLEKPALHDACHGFRKGFSIATNAKPHTGKPVVINLDMKDFFPTVSAARVYGLFRSLGFEDRALRFVTDACVFQGRIPQGAPTSPMIANLVCRRLDARLTGLAKKIGGAYTRYADDMTFSGGETIVRYIPVIKSIIEAEGFFVSLPKLRIHRQGRRQDVTGLTVNSKVSVPRAIRRRLRAAVHQFMENGKAEWKGHEIGMSELRGHINYVTSIQPEVGEKLRKRLKK